MFDVCAHARARVCAEADAQCTCHKSIWRHLKLSTSGYIDVNDSVDSRAIELDNLENIGVAVEVSSISSS